MSERVGRSKQIKVQQIVAWAFILLGLFTGGWRFPFEPAGSGMSLATLVLIAGICWFATIRVLIWWHHD